jgi:hypothetical protein
MSKEVDPAEAALRRRRNQRGEDPFDVRLPEPMTAGQDEDGAGPGQTFSFSPLTATSEQKLRVLKESLFFFAAGALALAAAPWAVHWIICTSHEVVSLAASLGRKLAFWRARTA